LDKGETKAAECKALANKLRNQVDDPDGALDNIVSLASNPDEADEVLKLLKRIDAESGSQPPKFAGRPTLKITRDEQDTIRSSGIFPDDPPPDALPQGGPVRIRQIGSQQKGHEFREGMEQGAYTSESTDRASNAVLRSWNNPMDIQEVQVLPKGSVILRGPAAPMTEKQHSGAMSRDVPPETLKGGATQIAHLGQIDSTTGKVSATAAQRKVKGPVSDVWH